MFQNGQKVVVVSGGDERRVIKVQAVSDGDASRYPVVDTTGVSGRDQSVQIVSGGDPTRFPQLRGLATARSTADAVISALSPAAWYRNATDVVSSGGFASIWADYASSDVGLVLPGVASNRASIPDSAPTSLTGDLDIALRIKLDDWTGASTPFLITKSLAAPGDYGWYFYIAATIFQLRWTPTGNVGELVTASATVASGLTDGTAYWVRVTLDVDLAGQWQVKFYTAADSATVPSSWTQLGATVNGATGPTSIDDAATGISVGAAGDGSQPTKGIAYRAIVKDGIDGTTVFDADFSSQAIGAGSFTESSSNAATVTINASGAAPAHIGKARDLLQGTGTNQPAYAAGVFTFDGADNWMKAAFTLNQPATFIMVVQQISHAANDALMDGAAGNYAQEIYQSGVSPAVAIYAGSVAAANSNLAVGSYGILAAVFNGASSSLKINATAATTGNAGASNAGGIVLGANGTGLGVFANAAYKEVVVFASALSDTNRDAVITALNNALTVF